MTDLFYTVLCAQQGYPVRYLDRQTCHTGRFTGPFSDPGEASQEFQSCMGGTACCSYLDEQQFQATACALIRQHRQVLRAWQAWNAAATGYQTRRARKEESHD
jgi:hypothetical protein